MDYTYTKQQDTILCDYGLGILNSVEVREKLRDTGMSDEQIEKAIEEEDGE